MRILILSTHLNTGGISRYIVTLTQGLQHNGHHVHVVTAGGDMVGELLQTGANHLALNIKTKSELDLKIYLALRPLLKLIRDNAIDVIHAQTRVTQVMGAVLHRLTSKSYVSTCHGFFKLRLSRRIISGWGEKVIAISEAVKRSLMQDFKMEEERIALIPNGIPLADFQPVSEEIKIKRRREYQLGQEPVIGIIARLSDVKGHSVLIESMKKVITHIPTAKLLIIGRGHEELLLKKKTKDLNLEGHIRFLPIVNKTVETLSLFDVFVMPSLQEGLGLSILEAMAMGIPVVASNVGGIPTIVDDGVTGLLVPPNHAEALATAMEILLQHKDKAQNMAQEARRMVTDRYSAKRMVDDTVKVYESLLRKQE